MLDSPLEKKDEYGNCRGEGDGQFKYVEVKKSRHGESTRLALDMTSCCVHGEVM